jgi:phosphatidylserine/phosphatidylglycerophosphate/cardiolipin synthase-like enzyme
MHAKYVVADRETVLIGSENFGGTGYPLSGVGNRGWGVVIRDAGVAQRFEHVFVTDSMGGSGGVRTLEPSALTGNCPEAPDGESGRSDGPEIVSEAVSLETLFSPSPIVLDRLLSVVRESTRSIDAEHLQVPPRWHEDENAVLEALSSAASSGTHVRLLMDSKYADSDRDSNLATLRGVDAQGETGLEARLAVLGALSKIHNKGFIFDSDAVWVGSANLGEASFRRNREAVILLHSAETAQFFTGHFDADWANGGKDTLPSLSAIGLIALVAAGSFHATYSSLSEALRYRRRHK